MAFIDLREMVARTRENLKRINFTAKVVTLVEMEICKWKSDLFLTILCYCEPFDKIEFVKIKWQIYWRF